MLRKCPPPPLAAGQLTIGTHTVEHLFLELLKEHRLEALEKRRPRIFGGMGARLGRELTLSELALSELALCTTELDKSLLRGVLAGAVWTADRAHRRGLSHDDRCPYHLLWWCEAWKATRDSFLPNVMLLARALKLAEWPPSLRLY